MVRGPWHRAGTLSNSTTKTSKWFKRALKTNETDERWQLKPKTNLASRVLWSCFLLLPVHHRCLEMSITLQISASLLLDQPNFRKYRLGSRRFMIPFSFPSYTSYTEVSDAWPRFLLHVAFFPCPLPPDQCCKFTPLAGFPEIHALHHLQRPLRLSCLYSVYWGELAALRT